MRGEKEEEEEQQGKEEEEEEQEEKDRRRWKRRGSSPVMFGVFGYQSKWYHNSQSFKSTKTKRRVQNALGNHRGHRSVTPLPAASAPVTLASHQPGYARAPGVLA